MSGEQVPKSVEEAPYIKMLEERLRDIEQRLLAVEAAATSRSREIKEGRNREGRKEDAQKRQRQPHSNGKIDPPDGCNCDHGRPHLPPTIPKVSKLGLLAYTHQALPAHSRPAIEVLMQNVPLLSLNVDANDALVTSLADDSPEMALEVIKAAVAYDSQVQVDSRPCGVRITSKRLGQLLLSLICNHEATSRSWSLPGPLSLHQPYTYPIFNHGKVKQKLVELETSLIVDQDPGLLEELRCYTQVMEGIMAFYQGFHSKSASDKFQIYYQDLLHLFKPGDTIFYREATTNSCALDYDKLKSSRCPDQKFWRVYTGKYGVTPNCFTVKAYCIGHDGESFVCIKESFKIADYDGLASVTSLKVFPAQFASNSEKLMATAVAEGRKFREFLQRKVLAHDGWASELNEKSPTLHYITGDVVIDFAETFRANPSWKSHHSLPSTAYTETRGKLQPCEDMSLNWHWVDEGKLRTYMEAGSCWVGHPVRELEKRAFCRDEDPFLSSFWDDQKRPYSIQEADYHLLPGRLFGYSLQNRKFVSVSVNNLKPIEDLSSRLQDLIIDENHEKMLRALVLSHFARKQLRESTGLQITNQDIIQNKGKGLVILLHGVPGVGKTSTAEAMAIEFGKPLLPMTCGDLGLEPEVVEDSLKELFRLAQTWDCILLLDEADVFLTERIPSDLRRNALVSVFLRVLDYYDGVLFLTTNRVGTIDEAFKSRIHASFYYRPLTKSQTENIWAMNLRRLAQSEDERSRITKEPPLIIDRDGILQFARDEFQKGKEGKEGRSRWNGRQIRNAVLTASALARYDKTDTSDQQAASYNLRVDHFKVVVKSGLAFERYLYKVKRMTDGEKAFVDGVRADHTNLNIRSAKASTESTQDFSRNPNMRPVTPVMSAASQIMQQWPHAQPTGHSQPHNVGHGDFPLQNPVYLSPGSQASRMQHPQPHHYPVETGYPGQMSPQPMGMHQTSPLGGYGDGRFERPGDGDSSDGM
ncbi:hypothetical protein BJX99DRAFT_256654 [Aspergillus californicus]